MIKHKCHPKICALRPAAGIHSMRRDERGSMLVETALSLTLLFLIVFGILECSLAVYSYHYLSHAARQGSRYAMVRGASWGTTCTDYTSSGCIATEPQIEQYVQSLGFPGIDGNNLQVSVSCSTAVGGTFVDYNGASCNARGDVVEVTVTYPFSISIAGINGSCPSSTNSSPAKYCMSSSSQMVISQ